MSISPLTGIQIPIPDVPWRSQWRIDLEARMHEPVRYKAAPVPKPVRPKRVAVPRTPRPPRDPKLPKEPKPPRVKAAPKPYFRANRPKTVRLKCHFPDCAQLILPSNTWGICTPCRQKHRYILSNGTQKACACGNPMNKNNRYDMCGKCYHKARYMMKKRGEC